MKTIMLIDDERSLHMSFELLVNNMGYNFSSISDPDKALEYARTADAKNQTKPNLIFIDLMMQHVLGTEVIYLMNQNKFFDGISLILHTGYDYHKQYGEKVKAVKLTDILLKPASSLQLKEIINKYVQHDK